MFITSKYTNGDDLEKLNIDTCLDVSDTEFLNSDQEPRIPSIICLVMLTLLLDPTRYLRPTCRERTTAFYILRVSSLREAVLRVLSRAMRIGSQEMVACGILAVLLLMSESTEHQHLYSSSSR